MRRAKFEATGNFGAGCRKASVIVEQDGPHALVRVRPYRRHEEAVLPLSDVAEMVLMREARLRAAESSRRGNR